MQCGVVVGCSLELLCDAVWSCCVMQCGVVVGCSVELLWDAV